MRSITRHLSPGLAALAVLGIAGTASAAPPDLTPFVDTGSDSGSALATNKWFVDTTASPYSARFRFGTQIQNIGADPFRITQGAASGPASARTAVAVQQIVGGVPTALTQVKLLGSPFGLSGVYSWRIDGVAKYSLTPAGQAPIESALGAVCRDDSAAFLAVPPPALFDPPACQLPSDAAVGFNSGITNGWMDNIAPSAANAAYFDVTTAPAGAATFTATIDPFNEIVESNNANNVASPAITLPGVSAQPAALTTRTTTAVSANLSATVVGPTVLGRKLNQALEATDPAQPVPAPATGTLAFALAAGPANGTATVTPAGLATYTARAGFTGADSFTYYAEDSRGIRSPATTVSVNVTAVPGGGGGGGGTTPPPPGTINKITLKLTPAYTVVKRGNKTFLKVSGKLPVSQAGRTIKIQRKVGKKVTTLSTVRIATNGKFSKLVRVSTRTVSVRTTIAASATAKASTSAFRSVVIRR
jgi:hypothetical protein